jgi:hypothetical protein
MEELLYCLFYVKSLQQARELGEEEASERLGRMDQSGASILPRKTAGPVPCFYKGNRPLAMLGTYSRSCIPHRFDVILLIPLTRSHLEPAAVILPVLFSEHGMTTGSAKVNIPRGNAEEK